jgi:dTDP-4-amino-4,6-dideoxygalactose transaminase
VGFPVVPFLDLTRQYKVIQREILSVSERVYERGQFVLGEEVSLFEEEFARYCGVRYAVGVGSGTAALHLALRAAGIGEGDEVVTTAYSFIATALAISFSGARPVFVDIQPETYTMDPEALERVLRRRTSRAGRPKIKAVIPVHLYGQPAPMDHITQIAERYGLRVIEDACQSHGAEIEGKRTGSFGALGCFSFYPTKNLGAFGDGGMVVTDHKAFYEKLRMLRQYGSKQKYRHAFKGDNSRLDEIQAAILRVKLRHLDGWNEARRRKAALYRGALQSCPILPPVERGSVRHVYHLFVVRTKNRNGLQRFLENEGIQTLIHYPIPIHLQDAYRELDYGKGSLPETERCCREVLSLPFFPEIEGSEILEVAAGIKAFHQRRR